METNEALEEHAWFDAMNARQSALEAMVGHFTTLNVPSDHLRVILRQSTDNNMRFAVQIVLHQRGEEWASSSLECPEGHR